VDATRSPDVSGFYASSFENQTVGRIFKAGVLYVVKSCAPARI